MSWDEIKITADTKNAIIEIESFIRDHDLLMKFAGVIYSETTRPQGVTP